MNPRIIFFGNERLSTGTTTETPLLKALIKAGYEVVAVVVAQKETGNSRKQRPLEVVEVAEHHNIPVLAPNSLKEPEIVSELASYEAVAGVLAAYGKIIPQNVIDVFPKGIVNVHPSLLPRHRGSIPIEGAILNGEAETGVSLMALSAGMDTGPIYSQETIKLDGAEEKQALTNKLSLLGADMMVRDLPRILDGSLEAHDQNEDGVTVDSRISKESAVLDFTKPAITLEREVRAFAGWPRSKTQIGSYEVVITKAHTSDARGEPGYLWIEDKQIGFHCSEGTLIIDLLIPVGKKEMSAAAFLSGYSLTN